MTILERVDLFLRTRRKPTLPEGYQFGDAGPAARLKPGDVVTFASAYIKNQPDVLDAAVPYVRPAFNGQPYERPCGCRGERRGASIVHIACPPHEAAARGVLGKRTTDSGLQPFLANDFHAGER